MPRSEGAQARVERPDANAADTRLTVRLLALAMLVLLFWALPVGSAGASTVADEPESTGSVGTEPVGEDTTDPESSAENASPAPTWLWYVLAAAVVGGVVLWLLNRRRAAESAEP